MLKGVIGVAAFAAVVSGSAANAAITIGSNVPGVNPYAGPAPTFTFDPGSQPINVGPGGSIVTGTLGSQHAQPFGTSAGTGAYGGLGNYLAVGPGDGSPAVLDLSSYADIGSISFIWGSVDSYNTLDFLAANGTTVLQSFTGNDIFNPANGNRTDPDTNPLVTFLLTGADVSAFTYLRLTSADNAFEIDNLAINASTPRGAVPEPATWALMLVGFAGMGFSLRRRRHAALAQIA